MSRTYSVATNKHQHHQKVHAEQYLHNLHEPSDDVSRDVAVGIEMRLPESGHFIMRRQFRQIARQMGARERY
ncbi:MAG TPA: hypothetical protein VLF40_04730 [Candidatus Saccharimonadales bacterium]|nr:hypothetical protein [Candidatus Saccharimonadales bacterium]